MARDAETIQAEIEVLKAQGVDGRSAPVRALRAELKALGVGVGAPARKRRKKKRTRKAVHRPELPKTEAPQAMFPGEQTRTVSGGPSVVAVIEADPFKSDEWDFIQKACAEVKLQNAGNQSGVVMKFYLELWAKVQVWRIAREVVQEFGIGAEWPSWASLHRDPSTGKKFDAKPAPAPKAASNGSQKPPTVTEGGMPIRMASPAPAEMMAALAPPMGVPAPAGMTDTRDMRQVLKRSILGNVESRPVPQRENAPRDE